MKLSTSKIACLGFILGTLVWISVSFMLNISKTFAVPYKTSKVGVLVTGCSSGLGLDLVRTLLEEYESVEVFAGVRKEKDFQQLRNFKNQQRLHPLVLDVADPKLIDAAIMSVEKSGIPLYALINNAGISMPGRPGLGDAKSYTDGLKSVFETNIFGLARLTGESLKLMRNAASTIGSARIVNVGSIMGTVYTPSCSGYCASKHALEALTADWRYHLEPYNISVSVLQPGFFRTNMCTKGFCKDDPSVCSKVVMHAIFSNRPQPRYQCASVFGIPGWAIARLVTVVPDRLIDLVLRVFENLEQKGHV